MLESVAPRFSKKPIKIVGCGLAGAEIAFILANNGFDVHIFDGNAEKIGEIDFDEDYGDCLVENMKTELESLNSSLFSVAKRYNFSNFGEKYDQIFMQKVKALLKEHPKIKIFDANIDTLSDSELTIVASGHNTTKKLVQELKKYVGDMHFCYFQPIELMIDAKSVDKEKLTQISQTEFCVNLTEEEYKNFYQEIITIDKTYTKSKDLVEILNEKQITLESLAQRGFNGLRNSILRPYFAQSNKPYASLKLTYNKKDDVFVADRFCSAFSDEDQMQLLKQINLLKNCKVLQFGKLKHSTFLLAPMCLTTNLQIVNHEKLYVCGGLAGVGGCLESLLLADFCAYSVISALKNTKGVDILACNTCIGAILDNLLKKSVVNFRLFNLKYDIINKKDCDFAQYDKMVEVQKILSKSQVEKFKEKFYGKYF